MKDNRWSKSVEDAFRDDSTEKQALYDWCVKNDAFDKALGFPFVDYYKAIEYKLSLKRGSK